MLQAEIEIRLLFVSQIPYPRLIVFLSVCEGIFYVQLFYYRYLIGNWIAQFMRRATEFQCLCHPANCPLEYSTNGVGYKTYEITKTFKMHTREFSAWEPRFFYSPAKFYSFPAVYIENFTIFLMNILFFILIGNC